MLNLLKVEKMICSTSEFSGTQVHIMQVVLHKLDIRTTAGSTEMQYY